MAVTHVAYEVEGWGVGELWLEGGRVVWHELPVRPAPQRRVGDRELELVRAAAARTSAASRTTSTTSRSTSSTRRRSSSAARRRCAAIPRGEVVTYGELAALAGAPGAARAAGSFCARNRLGLFVPCHRVVGAGGLGSYGSLGARLQAAAAGARGCRSLRSSATSSRRSRRTSDCDRLAELSGPLPRRGERAPAAAAARSPCISTSRARRSRAARSRCCARSTSTRRSARTSSTRSTRRRATSCTSRERRTRYETLHQAGVLDALAPAARAAAAARARPPLLPRARTCAARCSAPAR